MSNLRNILRVTVLGSSNKDGVPFEPSKDIPSLAGQVVVVTGGVGGIGTATVTALARYGRPARLYIADLPPKDEAAKTALLEGLKRGISEEKKEAAAADADAAASPEDETELHFLDLNLSSFESVRACAAAFAEREERLDLLVCNAGILKGAYSMTQEGYESHFGINYLGHALLARLLLPKMVRTVDEHPGGLGRVVFVSSEGHIMIPKGGIAFDKLKTDCKGMSYLTRYGQSKLALIHLVKQLAQEYPKIRIMAIHPGRVATGIADELSSGNTVLKYLKGVGARWSISPEQGAKNQLWAATSPDAVSGKYYEPIGVPDRESKLAKDETLRKRLGEWTETELKDVKPL